MKLLITSGYTKYVISADSMETLQAILSAVEVEEVSKKNWSDPQKYRLKTDHKAIDAQLMRDDELLGDVESKLIEVAQEESNKAQEEQSKLSRELKEAKQALVAMQAKLDSVLSAVAQPAGTPTPNGGELP